MKIKLFSLLTLLFLCHSLSGQSEPIKLTGTVKDSVEIVINANVVNLRSKDGTFTNDFGQFKIKGQPGDTLLISSIQHHTLKYVITERDIESKRLLIFMKMNRYELDEVVLKETTLSKNLALDVLKKKTNRNDKKASELEQILSDAPTANSFFKTIGSQPVERGMADVITKQVDPTRKYRGLGLSFGLGKKRDKTKIKIQKWVKQDQFHNQVINAVNIDYFETIKIHRSLITHFLKSCDSYQLKQLLKENKILNLMVYLETESIKYNDKRKSLTKD